MRPHGGNVALDVEVGDGLGELGIVAGAWGAILIVEPLMRHLPPFLIGDGGKVGGTHLANELRRLVPVGRQRNPTDIADDARKAVALDHRPDVVEHRRSHRSGTQDCHDHGDDAAARGADDRGMVNISQCHEIEHINAFDERGIIAPVGVVLRKPAAAVIEAIDGAAMAAGVGERGRQPVEIPGVARQPRQADDRTPRAAWGRVVPDMEPEPVMRGVIDVVPLTRFRHSRPLPSVTTRAQPAAGHSAPTSPPSDGQSSGGDQDVPPLRLHVVTLHRRRRPANGASCTW